MLILRCEGCYFCCPLGPLQTALCMLNPCTWVLCFNPAEEAKAKASTGVADVLSKHGVQSSFESGMMGPTMKFQT